MIQQAVAQVLGAPFEACFSEHSHGYRPGRSAHQAVAVMEEHGVPDMNASRDSGLETREA